MRFPQNIAFSSELQHKKYKDIIRRKIQPNKYPIIHALRTIGLLNEVSLVFHRVGWETFMIRTYPIYFRPTCEFLSSYDLDERATFITFRLGNKDFRLELYKLNEVFEFPKGHEANIVFDKDEFWRELMGDRNVTYKARTTR